MASIYVSPGVYVREKDISEIIANIATTTAALVGYSTKGETGVKLVTNSQQFIGEYGKPVLGNYFHYTALAFLENGNRLYCVRVINGALFGNVNIVKSSATGDNETASTGQSSAALYGDSADEDILFQIFGKDPGAWNNKISITIDEIKNAWKVQYGSVVYKCTLDHTSTSALIPGTDAGDDYWEAISNESVTGKPEWSGSSVVYVQEETEEYTFKIHVWYTDSDGNTSEVETWKVSRKDKVGGYGTQIYLQDKINGFSKYILVYDNTDHADTVLPKVQTTVLLLGGGANGDDATDSQIVTGWDKFTNPDDVDVRILLNGGETSVTVQTKMKVVAEARKDCMAILDIPYAQLGDVDDMVTWRTVTQNFNTSYTALYTPWVKVNDPYNDRIVEIPPSGYVGSQFAYNDYIAKTWSAPAGFNRGILNILGLTNIFTQGHRDSLYEKGINPLQTFRGAGHVIWGQKTQQVKASALDRVNVRRLLIMLEKTIAATLNNFAFEPNSTLTRFRVTALLDEYLDELSASGAFQTEGGDKGFAVVCNTTNNTSQVIDANELHVDVFLKPSRTAEYIQLTAIITATGASFNELIQQGVMFT